MTNIHYNYHNKNLITYIISIYASSILLLELYVYNNKRKYNDTIVHGCVTGQLMVTTDVYVYYTVNGRYSTLYKIYQIHFYNVYTNVIHKNDNNGTFINSLKY